MEYVVFIFCATFMLIVAIICIKKALAKKRRLVDVEIILLGHSGAGKTSSLAHLIDKINLGGKNKHAKIWGDWLDDREELDLRKLRNFTEEAGKRPTQMIVKAAIEEDTQPGSIPENLYFRIFHKDSGENMLNVVKFYDLPGKDFEQIESWHKEEIHLKQDLKKAAGIILYINQNNPPAADDRKRWMAYTNAIKQIMTRKPSIPVWIALTHTDQSQEENTLPAKEYLQSKAKRFAPILDFSEITNFIEFHSLKKENPAYDNDMSVFLSFYQEVAKSSQKHSISMGRRRKLNWLSAVFGLVLSLLFCVEAIDSWLIGRISSPREIAGFKTVSQMKDGTLRLYHYVKYNVSLGHYFYRKKVAIVKAKIFADKLQKLYQKEILFSNKEKRGYLNTRKSDLDKQLLEEKIKGKLSFLESYLICRYRLKKIFLLQKKTSELAKLKKRASYLKDAGKFFHVYRNFVERYQSKRSYTYTDLQQIEKYLQPPKKFRQSYQKLTKKCKRLAKIESFSKRLQEIIDLLRTYFSTIATEKNQLSAYFRQLILQNLSEAINNVHYIALQSKPISNLEPLSMVQKRLRLSAIIKQSQNKSFKHCLQYYLMNKITLKQNNLWQRNLENLENDLRLLKNSKWQEIQAIHQWGITIKNLQLPIPFFARQKIALRTLECIHQFHAGKPQKKRFQSFLHFIYTFVTKASKQELSKILDNNPDKKSAYSAEEELALTYYFFSEYMQQSIRQLPHESYSHGLAKITKTELWIKNRLECLKFSKSFVKKWHTRVLDLKNFPRARKISLKTLAVSFIGKNTTPQNKESKCFQRNKIGWDDSSRFGISEDFALYLRVEIRQKIPIPIFIEQKNLLEKRQILKSVLKRKREKNWHIPLNQNKLPESLISIFQDQFGFSGNLKVETQESSKSWLVLDTKNYLQATLIKEKTQFSIGKIIEMYTKELDAKYVGEHFLKALNKSLPVNLQAKKLAVYPIQTGHKWILTESKTQHIYQVTKKKKLFYLTDLAKIYNGLKQKSLWWHPWAAIKIIWLDQDGNIDPTVLLDDDILDEFSCQFWHSGQQKIQHPFFPEKIQVYYNTTLELNLKIKPWIQAILDEKP